MSLLDTKKRYFTDSLTRVNERIMSVRTRNILGRHPFPNSSAKESVFNALIKLADVVYNKELYIHDFSDLTKYDRKTGLFREMLRGLVSPTVSSVDLMGSAISETEVRTLLKAINTEDSLIAPCLSSPGRGAAKHLKPPLRPNPPSPFVQGIRNQTSSHPKLDENMLAPGGNGSIAGKSDAIGKKVFAKIDLNKDGPNILVYASDVYWLHQLGFRSKKVQQPIDLVDELFPDSSGSYPRQSQYGSVTSCSKGKQRIADTGNSTKTSLPSKRKARSQDADEDNNSEETGEGDEHPSKRQNFQLNQNDYKLSCLDYEKASAEKKESHSCRDMEFKTIAEQIDHQGQNHKEFHCLYGAYHKVFPHKSYPKDNDCCKIFPNMAGLKRHTQRVHIRAICCENCCENFAQECIEKHRGTHGETRLRHRTRYEPVVDFSTEVNKARTVKDMWQIMFSEQDGPKYDVLSKTDHLDCNASDGYPSDILDDIAMLGERISNISDPIEMFPVLDVLMQQTISILHRMCPSTSSSTPSESETSTNSSHETIGEGA